MENIEVQRTSFDKICVILVGVNQGEKFGESLGKTIVKHSDQN